MPKLPISSPPPPLPSSTHGGSRPGAGRERAPYKRKKVTLELPQPLLDAWDTHCQNKLLSRADSLTKWLKWKKPARNEKLSHTAPTTTP